MMSTNTQTNWIVQDKLKNLNPAGSPQVQELMTLARQEAWDFAVLGQAPMPKQPIRLQDWLVVPAEQDTSEIPERALERVQAIFATGIRPKGFVLVHEAPMQLPAPQGGERPILEPRWTLDPEHTQQVIKGLSFGVTAFARVMVAAVGLVTTVILPAVFLTGAALIDPILIAVTEDDHWIEIDRWWV
jgi:hypothetical protein